MFITCVFQDRITLRKWSNRKNKEKCKHQRGKEWRSGNENHSWGNLSISGRSNESNFPAAAVSFSSCGMQIHGPCTQKLFEPMDTVRGILGWTFILSQPILSFRGWRLCENENSSGTNSKPLNSFYMWRFCCIVNCKVTQKVPSSTPQ